MKKKPYVKIGSADVFQHVVFFFLHSTMGQNREKHRINSYPIIHCPTSKEVSEVSEQASATEGASEGSSLEQANE